MPRTPLVVLTLAAAFAAPPTPAAVPDAGSPPAEQADGGPRPAFETLSGRVRHVDWKGSRIAIDTGGGEVTLAFNRDTMVFLPDQLGTLADLKAGAPVRASADPQGTAFWIEIRRPEASSASAAGARVS